jgi:hypothetical protein
VGFGDLDAVVWKFENGGCLCCAITVNKSLEDWRLEQGDNLIMMTDDSLMIRLPGFVAEHVGGCSFEPYFLQGFKERVRRLMIFSDW